MGIVGKDAGKYDSKNEAMLFTLAKRGPDDKGILRFPSCTLGQTRLSILDLEGGRQPMKDNTRDFSVTFNGEIYNYLELRKELEQKGHHFSTASDTEVILKAYAEYGEDCPKHLDGMFAFGLWDNERDLLFAARDRFGKKPFYYTFDSQGTFIFASEIKALLASGKIQGDLDYQAIDDYLSLMYIPPTMSVYKNIFTLAPAEHATVLGGQIKKERYWELEYSPLVISYQDAKEEVRRLLSGAIKKRLIADVEIGSFLSGGVDSTLVTAYAQRFSDKPLKTFAFGYNSEKSELPFAKEAAKKIGTEHYELHGEENIIESLEKCMAYFDEPHADSSDFPQALISEFASKKVKVALTGDGADELFMGYGWYTKHKHLSYRAHFFEKLFLDPFQGYIHNISLFSKKEREKIWGGKNIDNFLPHELRNAGLPPIIKINLFDLTTYLPGQLMVKSDRMAMMHSLEVRSPFLDHHLAEFVFNMPTDFKLQGDSGKIMVKDLLSEIMPEKFVYRRKQGFGAPIEKWLQRKEVKNFIYKNIIGRNSALRELFGRTNFEEFFIDYYEKGVSAFAYKIWVLLCLEVWLQKHPPREKKLTIQ